MTRRRAAAAALAVAVLAGLIAAWIATRGGEEPAGTAPVATRGFALAGAGDGRAFAAIERLDRGGSWSAAVARAGDDGGPLDAGSADVPLENPRGIAVERGGAVLVAGDREEGGRRRLAVARVSPDGEVDRAFGRDGVATIAAGPGDAVARSLVTTPAGIVVVGDATDGDSQALAIATLPADGRRGRVALVPDVSAAGAAVGRDGNPVVAGTATSDGAAVLVRLRADGRPETTRAPSRLAGTTWSAVAVTRDGGAVLVGSGRDAQDRSVIAVQSFGADDSPGRAAAVAAGDGDAYGAAAVTEPGGAVTVGGTGVVGDRPVPFVFALGGDGAPAEPPRPHGSGRLVGMLRGSVVLVNRWDGRAESSHLYD